MNKLNKKGFTLTEMIVVIAIIGILAGVLIPTITGYIKRANRSNDEQLAASMTDEIERYCIENNLNQDKLSGADVRTILTAKGYNLEPSRDDWTYVYNSEEKEVVVSDLTRKGVLKADDTFTPVDPSNISENKYIVGEGNTDIEQAIKYLLNFDNSKDFATVVSSVPTEYQSVLNTFNPSTTLYIDNVKCINKPDSAVTSIVYTVGTYNIPNITSVSLSGTDFVIPQVINSVNKYTAEKFEKNFTNVKNVTSNKNYTTINLANININISANGKVTSDSTYYFGELVETSVSQSIAIDVLGYTTIKVDTNNDGKIDENDKDNGVYTRETRLVYEVTIIYFGTDGIVAQGTKTILSEVINSNLLGGIYANHQYIEIK